MTTKDTVGNVGKATRIARPSLIGSAATVGSFTMISRLLGFVRDMMMAALLGAGPLADAFLVAFKLPNFLRRLFAEGAFNAGFVPLFARTLEGEGKAAARNFAAQAQAVLAAVLVPLVIAAIVFMPWVIRTVVPGLDVGSERYEAAVSLSRITFCYILFISLVALYGGILNSMNQFAVPAATPIILNLCLIAGLLISYFWSYEAAYALAWGLAAAGLGQFLWVVLAARRQGMGLGLRVPRFSSKIKRLFALILPGVFGAGIAQVNLLIDVVFTSFLAEGAFSYLYYADRLAQLPLGVIGVAVGTALLPLMSRQLRAGETADAIRSQNRGIELSLLLTIPAAIGLAVLSLPIITAVFQWGAFVEADSIATSAALSAYALGLPAYVLIKVLAPGFFAREDTITPVKIAVACLLANIVCMLLLIGPLKHVGIALATVISAWLNAALLGVILHRRNLFSVDDRLRHRLPRVLVAGLAMALVIWLVMSILAESLPMTLALGITISLGAISFFAVAQALGAFDWKEVKALLRRSKA